MGYLKNKHTRVARCFYNITQGKNTALLKFLGSCSARTIAPSRAGVATGLEDDEEACNRNRNKIGTG